MSDKNSLHETSIMSYFSIIPDPRKERNQVYNLFDLITIAILCILYGADDWVEVNLWATANIDWLKQFGICLYGVPSHDTLSMSLKLGLQNSTIEKDYVLGRVLMGIQNNTKTKDSWIFKGGTCLKKCFFDEYRFSEDLDFTLIDSSQMTESFLMGILKELSEWTYEETGLVDVLKPQGSHATAFGGYSLESGVPEVASRNGI